MSMDFTVAGCRLGSAEWLLLARDLDAAGIRIHRAGMDPEGDPPVVSLHPVGGLRGVSVEVGSAEARVILSAMANLADFRLAAAMIRAAVASGGGTLDCDGEALAIEEFTDQWVERQAETWGMVSYRSLRESFAGPGPVTLPGPFFDLQCHPEDLAGGTYAAAQEVLSRRAESRISMEITRGEYGLGPEEGEVVCHVVLAPRPSILPLWVTHCTFAGHRAPLGGMVPVARVREILAACFVVPQDMKGGLDPIIRYDGTDLGDLPDAVEQLKAAAVPAPDASLGLTDDERDFIWQVASSRLLGTPFPSFSPSDRERSNLMFATRGVIAVLARKHWPLDLAPLPAAEVRSMAALASTTPARAAAIYALLQTRADDLPRVVPRQSSAVLVLLLAALAVIGLVVYMALR